VSVMCAMSRGAIECASTLFSKSKNAKSQNRKIVEMKNGKRKAYSTRNTEGLQAFKAPKSLKSSRTFKSLDYCNYGPPRTQETHRFLNKSSDSAILLTMKRLSPSLPDGPLLKEGPLWAQSSNRGRNS
jgi:hypothetical protein